MRRLLYLFAVLYLAVYDASAWGSDKVKLKDVEVLTLRVGHFTTGRRSAPVPQIRCVGGTAGCSAFVPQVVQCYNRGYDGYDVNWECKADMDNEFRFGEIAVTCEGYDHPDDPYILKGSCGFEYNLDLTKEGYEKRSRGGYQQQESYSKSNSYQDYIKPMKKNNDLFSLESLTLAVGIGIFIYAIYKTCIAPRDDVRYQGSTTNDDFHDRPRPPPYGFNVPPSAPPMDDTCPGSSGSCGPRPRASTSGGGFWTGAATGGLLGYMFGSSRNRGNTTYDQTAPRSSSWFGGGSSGYSSSSYSSSSPSTSSGTRSASGFGGTRRR